jgi:hypothetical protein
MSEKDSFALVPRPPRAVGKGNAGTCLPHVLTTHSHKSRMRAGVMASKTSYVSDELTHFVGWRIKSLEGRYALLLKILREGRLICKEGSGGLVIDPFTKFTTNRMIRPDGVCFCDIPLGGLAIHMRKYSQFGLAFPKSFLLEQGANPVFYIANNSKLRFWTMAGKKAHFGTKDRGAFFNRQFSEFYDCLRAVKRFLYDRRKDPLQPDPLVTRLEHLEVFLSSFFGYCKCFDAGRAEDDKENFYMEREWRLRSNLAFEIGDVCRVILPRSFVERFKRDSPGFAGVEETVGRITSIRRR